MSRARAESLPTIRPERIRSVKIVGLGGVGGIVARYLVIFLASLGDSVRVVLIDGDRFEGRNAERMTFSRIGNKAAVVGDDLCELVAGSGVVLSSVEEYVSTENVDRLVHENDVVLLAVDNHATRKLVSDFCESHRRDLCLISGGNDGVEEDAHGTFLRGTYGNVQVHWRCAGRSLTPRLTALHPEIENPRDRVPTDQSCSALLESVPQILFANLATASAMLSAFLLYACDMLPYGEVCFDIAEGRMRPVI